MSDCTFILRNLPPGAAKKHYIKIKTIIVTVFCCCGAHIHMLFTLKKKAPNKGIINIIMKKDGAK